MCISLQNLKKLVPDFLVKVYFIQFLKVLSVVIISGAIIYSISALISASFIRLVITTLAYEILFSLLFYHFMLDTQTQKMIINNIQKKIFNKSPNE